MAFVHSSNTSLYGSPLPPDLDMWHSADDMDPGDDMYEPPPPPLLPPSLRPPSAGKTDEESCALSRLSAMSALLDMFPSHDAGYKRGQLECPFEGLGVFQAAAGETPAKKMKMQGEDDLDRLAIEEVRRATSDSFSFATRCSEMEFEPAPASFVRVFIVAFLISRFGEQGADMSRVRKHVVSPALAVFFGLAANDECVGWSCEQLVAGVGASWPQSAYRCGAAQYGRQVPVHVMQGSLPGVSLEEQFAQGQATPLLYAGKGKSAPFFRAMALQLLIAGGDKALPHKGYRFGSAPWGGRVLNPLLQTQVLCLHPHLRLYAALVTYVPEVLPPCVQHAVTPHPSPLSACCAHKDLNLAPARPHTDTHTRRARGGGPRG